MACCSGSTFTPAPDAALDPGKRVNFSFGMVLGVDDFRQEHRYLAARDERLLRESIGYGVISGLHVAAGSADSDATQVEVRVTPGLALLPDGKLVGVAAEQCASLSDWLEGPNGKNASGDFTAYVVLRYAETAGTPVPIPGEPCRDESDLQADSRIADSFTLDFSWTAPASTEDDGLRSFAAWLRKVEVQAMPSPAPDLASFQTAVEQAVGKAIEAGWPTSVNPPLAETPAVASELYKDLVIPYDHYAEFIAAAFDVWIRRLRSQYLAKHGPVPPAEGAAERGLLLAAIDGTLSTGKLSSLKGVRLLGRPQLAHLRLLQEWLFSKADDAPRDAHYVLGNGDPRLPNAQNLRATFARAGARRMARVDLAGADGMLHPAVVWPGSARNPADYYGPAMSAPIPVADGGTGQSAAPQAGQLLVGAPASSPPTPAAFALGWLQGATHGASNIANITVDVSARSPDILLDTIQDIDPGASPAFVGLSVSGTLTAGSLSVTTAATVTGAFSANGGITASALSIAALDSAVIGTDSLGQFVKARRWDGIAANIATDATYYYAPGQGHPIRIEDGGTGLAAQPQPLQMLIGRNDGAPPSYVLANLVAGANVTLTLNHRDLPPLSTAPARRIWNLQIDATGGSTITLPIGPSQGGTGQTAIPQSGQILVGDGNSGYALGSVLAANSSRNLSVSADASGVTVDTVQDLHPQAAPTFAALLLASPPAGMATHGLGWNRDTSEVVLTGAVNRGVHLLPTFPQRPQDFKAFGPGDQVLVYAGTAAQSTPFVAPVIDGQVLVIKVLTRAGGLTLEDSNTIDLGAIVLDRGESVTLVGARAARQWLVIGRS